MYSRCCLHIIRCATIAGCGRVVHPVPFAATLPQVGCGDNRREEFVDGDEASRECLRLTSCIVNSADILVQLSRQIFDAAVQWAMKSDKSNFWRGQRRARTESPRESVVAIRKSGNTIARNRNEECV